MLAQETLRWKVLDCLRRSNKALTALEISLAVDLPYASVSAQCRRLVKKRNVARANGFVFVGTSRYASYALIKWPKDLPLMSPDERLEVGRKAKTLADAIRILGHDEDFEPSRRGRPTFALPGSLEKIDVMSERVMNGEPVFHPGDVRFAFARCEPMRA